MHKYLYSVHVDNIMKCMIAILNNKQHLHVFTSKCSSKYVMTEITKIFLILFEVHVISYSKIIKEIFIIQHVQ